MNLIDESKNLEIPRFSAIGEISSIEEVLNVTIEEDNFTPYREY